MTFSWLKMFFSWFQFVSSIAKVTLITLILWENMEIKCAMSTLLRYLLKQFHFSLTFSSKTFFPDFSLISLASKCVATMYTVQITFFYILLLPRSWRQVLNRRPRCVRPLSCRASSWRPASWPSTSPSSCGMWIGPRLAGLGGRSYCPSSLAYCREVIIIFYILP